MNRLLMLLVSSHTKDGNDNMITFDFMFLIFGTIIGLFAGVILAVIETKQTKSKQNKITNKNKRNRCRKE